MSSMPNQKNVLHVFVGKAVNATVDATLIDSYADLNDGEIAVVDLDNKVINQAGSDIGQYETFRFAARIGTSLIYSPWLNPSKIISMRSQSYAAPVQQITYLGYAGSGTGNIEAIDLNEYIVRLLMYTDTTSMFGNKQMYKFGAYKSSASATSAEVAIGLCDNLTHNFKREPEKTIQFDAVCSQAGVAIGGAADVVTGTAGENFVTIADTTDDDNIVVLAAGDFIRMGTAVTDPVYKIISGATTAAAGGTLYLDRPLTSTFSAHANDCEYITAAEGAACYWGIKMTGVALTKTRPGVFNYEVVTFKVEPQDCGTTTVTYSTAAVRGNGVLAQVQELQWFAQGNLGNKWRITVPPTTMLDSSTAGATYESIIIKYKDQQGDTVLGDVPASFGEIYLAFVVNSVFGDAMFLTLDHVAANYLGTAMTAWS